MVFFETSQPEGPFVPWAPEDLSSLRARFAKALINTYGIGYEVNGLPGNKPEHVFDMPDGMRLIVSFDVVNANSLPVLHLSCSAKEGSELFNNVSKRCVFEAVAELTLVAAYHIGFLAGMTIPLSVLGVRIPHGIIHFLGVTRQRYEAMLSAKLN